MASNSKQCSCLTLPNARITSINHHAQLCVGYFKMWIFEPVRRHMLAIPPQGWGGESQAQEQPEIQTKSKYCQSTTYEHISYDKMGKYALHV